MGGLLGGPGDVGCAEGCVCSQYVEGRCVDAPAAGICGGGCSAYYWYGFGAKANCADGCLCSRYFDGECVAEPAPGECAGACNMARFDGPFCQDGCICDRYINGGCVKPPGPGECGGGCSPDRGVNCPAGCVCTDSNDGTCVSAARTRKEGRTAKRDRD
jgi:hypothetical protein